MPEQLAQRLADGLNVLNIRLAEARQQQLLAYIKLLMKWNRRFNLSAIRDPLQAVDKHLLDSLSLLPELEPGPDYLDIGAGAGLPGIPLAIARPELRFCLVDANGKKTRFMQQAVASLQLPNVRVLQTRIETLPPTLEFTVVTARALGTLAQMLEWLGPTLRPPRKLLAMKGVFPAQELSEIPAAYKVTAVKPLVTLPGTAARHAVVIEPQRH